MRNLMIVLGALLGLAGLGAQTALAAAGPWAANEQGRVRLIAAPDAVGAETGKLDLGLHFQMAEGWKIYWRSPGDAGFPPQLDLSGSENLAAREMLWPAPKRFALFGLQTFGYGGEVVLPIEARLERAGEALRLDGTVTYLTCSEICVPHEMALSLALPAGNGGTSEESTLIASYRQKVPGDGSADGLAIEAATLSGELEAPTIKVTARATEPFEKPDLLIEGPPGYLYDKPTVALSDNAKTAELSVPVTRAPGAQGVLEGKRLTLTLTDDERAMETTWPARYADTSKAPAISFSRPAPTTDWAGLAAILALAVLGGLILNVMPCVLPVLSIKLLKAVGHGGRDSAPVRRGFLASAAGILFSFLVLAAGAIALKQTGAAVGWGIQFQQPLFLAAMALIVTLFALNLFGFFEVHLPSTIAGHVPQGRETTLLAHFGTGAFATLLATPCSAPFVGTAVSFALARGSLEILAIFAAMGLGLALPYLAVAAFPRLATRLPAPGPWMVTLKRILGLALAATAAWLLTVILAQTDWATTAVLAGLLIALAAVIWLRRRRPNLRRAASGAAIVISAGLLVLAGLAESGGATTARPDGDNWVPLDEARIAQAVQNDRLVFVDVTADWCITCQVNKQLVLNQGAVAERLEGGEILTMRGDWTRPDPTISAYLERFGRYGIPFNAVYGPGAPKGIALPELLSEDAVLEALEKARQDS